MTERTTRWFVYGFKGDKLAATYADTLMDLASIKGKLHYRGWQVFQRVVKQPMLRVGMK